MIAQTSGSGPATVVTEGTSRMSELAGAGRGFLGDESNVAGLLVLAALGGLIFMSKSFNGLTVSVR